MTQKMMYMIAGGLFLLALIYLNADISIQSTWLVIVGGVIGVHGGTDMMAITKNGAQKKLPPNE